MRCDNQIRASEQTILYLPARYYTEVSIEAVPLTIPFRRAIYKMLVDDTSYKLKIDENNKEASDRTARQLFLIYEALKNYSKKPIKTHP